MKWPFVRFGLVFFLFLLGFSVLSVATNLQNHLHLAENGIAGAATWLAHSVGSVAVVNENIISVSGLSLDINHECTGVFVLFVLISFIAAYPARWTIKVLGILIGVSVLTLINVLRIVTLVRIVEFYPGLFVYFHEYVWQGAFLMLVTLYALTWVEWARR
ncbi:MAG TPA: archaeosortase/exosortase family protein [Candidatus Margulisiibacteriota bacterium]|nr:archaeosortase/exosortase family protein [Candidatus Margulisiibacteriota bacterium]